MKALEPTDRVHVQAAEGWIGLGDYSSAKTGLEQIGLANCAYPDALWRRWLIQAKAGHWDACLDLAEALSKAAPELSFAWASQAESLHKVGRTQDARELLTRVDNKFEANFLIPFYLARYSLALGDHWKVIYWVAVALSRARGNPGKLATLRRMVDKDPEMLALSREL